MLRGVSSSLKHNIWESNSFNFSSNHGRRYPLFSDQRIAQLLLRPAACGRGLVEHPFAKVSSSVPCKLPTDSGGNFTCSTKQSAAEVLIRSVVDQRKFAVRRSVHKYAHPSWPQNLPVECWHFCDKAAVSKLVPLQEFEAELNSGNMEKELIAESGEKTESENLNRNKVSKWYLFSRRDEVTARVLKQCFNLHDTRISNPLTRAKVEFVSGATRRGDHLLVGVHDYRLQENERDGVEGYIDDISWVQEIYSDLLSAPDDQAPFEDSGLLTQRLVAHEVLFVYFPATSTLITIGADSTYMVLCGRAIMLNQASQVRTANARGEVGAGTLLLVLLDSFMDSVFPVLTLLGDAVDGIARLSVRRPEARHVVLAKRVKQQLHKILKHAWQFRFVFLELQQDFHGCVGRPALTESLIRSTKLIQLEAQTHLDYCQSVQDFHLNRLQERLNRTLQTLTGVSVVAIPAQLLTGYFGMNFDAMWLLHWEHGHALFWAAVATCTAGCAVWFRRAMRPPAPDPHPHPSRSTRRRFGRTEHD